jgi:hypothetical protein
VLVIGLDEAGYGPLLGPLVVGAAAFRLAGGARGATASADLRAALRGLACRAGEGRRGAALPVVLDDSKEVKRRHGVEGLSRGARWAAAAAGRREPQDLGDWLERFADRPPAVLLADPWHGEPELARLPSGDFPDDLRARCLLTGVEPLGLWVSPALPHELNEAWAGTDNKARVLFLSTMTLLLRVLAEVPAAAAGETVEVRLDREGGRLDYLAWLADVFPFHGVEELQAPDDEARYRVVDGGREIRLTFVTRGDGRHLEIGLASMAAKLTRELFLERMNAWFGARLPGLKPTAGYVEDGRRWLQDAAPVLDRERIDRARLVRSR